MAHGRPVEPVLASDGTRLTSHDQRPTTDDAVFGNACFARPYFTARGQVGCCLLDAELSVPARRYSDLLQEWAAYGATDESYRESPSVRLAKGQKRTKKQEAIVTALYPMSPYQRTPQDVVAALRQDSSRPELAARPQPVGTDLRATLRRRRR